MTVGSEVAGDSEERRKRRKWLPGDLKSGLTNFPASPALNSSQ